MGTVGEWGCSRGWRLVGCPAHGADVGIEVGVWWPCVDHGLGRQVGVVEHAGQNDDADLACAASLGLDREALCIVALDPGVFDDHDVPGELLVDRKVIGVGALNAAGSRLPDEPGR